MGSAADEDQEGQFERVTMTMDKVYAAASGNPQPTTTGRHAVTATRTTTPGRKFTASTWGQVQGLRTGRTRSDRDTAAPRSS